MATTTTDFSTKYSTHLNILHPAGEVIDVNAIVAANKHPWYNQTLCKVNESVVRLGSVQGEYHWHKHEDEDEFFYVVAAASSSRWKIAPSICAPAGVRRAEGRDASAARAGEDRDPDGGDCGNHSDRRRVKPTDDHVSEWNRFIWLALDRDGHVAAFATGGAGPIPSSVLDDGKIPEDLELRIRALPRTSAARTWSPTKGWTISSRLPSAESLPTTGVTCIERCKMRSGPTN